MIILVMGVTGSGKTTLGRATAEKMGMRFEDADDHHPIANREKMAAGIPLRDEDRLPWLQAMGARFQDWDTGGGVVLACSALKFQYRDILRGYAPDLKLVMIDISPDKALERALSRDHPFIHTDISSIISAQFRDLEPPTENEHPIFINSRLSVSEAVAKILLKLRGQQG